MGKKADPKCLYCAKNYFTEEEAKAKHSDCYVEKNRVCYHKRYRLRNASKVNAKRRDNYAKEQGIATINPILPDAFWVEFIVYGIRDGNVHAIGLKIYQGNQVRYKMFPQHTQGLSLDDLKEYVNKVMAHLESEYNIERIGSYYWVHPRDCPVCMESKF